MCRTLSFDLCTKAATHEHRTNSTTQNVGSFLSLAFSASRRATTSRNFQFLMDRSLQEQDLERKERRHTRVKTMTFVHMHERFTQGHNCKFNTNFICYCVL